MIGLAWQRDLTTRFSEYFDDFIEFSGWPGLPESSYEPEKVLSFLRDMQQQHFDIVLQMQGNGVLTNAMCKLWNGVVTCGLRKEGEYCFDETLFPISSDDEHEVRRFMKLLEALHVPSRGTHLEFPLSADEESFLAEYIQKEKLSRHQYVCLHPGSRDPKRRWHAENFAWVADRLSEQGYTVVLTGSAQEAAIIQNVEAFMKTRAINAVRSIDGITLGMLAALIKYAKLLVSNDTGVSHLAAAFSTPSVIIFSRYSTVSRWAPENSELHRIVGHDESDDLKHVWQCVQRQLHYDVPASTPAVAFQR
jgi:ADP-heptose:LPS heptosyltransferase